MDLQLNAGILNHLGLKMYSSIPAVLAEYVANSWDAGATKVNIQIPQKTIESDSEIVIRDNGTGMTLDDVNGKLLSLGTPPESAAIEVGGKMRRRMGSKGIGFFSGFGIANTIVVSTSSNNEYTEFQLDYEKIARGESTSGESHYELDYTHKNIDSNEDGTTVRLLNLRREEPPVEEWINRKLARRFGVRSDDFMVNVNGEPVSTDYHDLKNMCQFVWELDNVSIGGENEFSISGWVGTLIEPVPNEIEEGIAVMTNGRMVQEPTFFDCDKGGMYGQFSLTYMVGVVHADFMSSKERDLVSTNRSNIIWEEPPASYLHSFMNEKIQEIAKEWVSLRKGNRISPEDTTVDIEYMGKSLEQILSEGESERIEFKRNPPSSADSIAEEIASLVNYRGGVILFGVTDGGELYGLENVRDIEERIANIVRQNINPPVDPSINIHSVESETDIIGVEVGKENDRPRAVNGKYVTRVGTSKSTMTYREMIERFETEL